MISAFDLFKIGIGPSSSHTVGPMRAANIFVSGLKADGGLVDTALIRAELFGSLGATGHGHGSEKAVLLGLGGEEPETVDIANVAQRVAQIRSEINVDLILHKRRTLPFHPNGMTFTALDRDGGVVRERTYYSVGGGFVVDENTGHLKTDDTPVRYPFNTGAELLAHGLPISHLVLANEQSWRAEADVRAGLLHIWEVMQQCVQTGLHT
jgi:L-serine dehydratase